MSDFHLHLYPFQAYDVPFQPVNGPSDMQQWVPLPPAAPTPPLATWPSEALTAVAQLGRRVADLEESLKAVQASANTYVEQLRKLRAHREASRPLEVLVDMDGVLVDLLAPWLAHLNAEYGTSLTAQDIDQWDLASCAAIKAAGLTAAQVYGALQGPGLFRYAPPMPGALWGLKALHDAGHKVVIASSPSGPTSAAEKLEWLWAHAPWLPQKQVFLGNLKTMLRGDVLIEDHPGTLAEYAETWPHATCIGIRHPYNATHPSTDLITYVEGRDVDYGPWLDVKSIVDRVAASRKALDFEARTQF